MQADAAVVDRLKQRVGERGARRLEPHLAGGVAEPIDLAVIGEPSAFVPSTGAYVALAGSGVPPFGPSWESDGVAPGMNGQLLDSYG